MEIEKSREEFIVWIRQAINDKTSVAYVELYRYLVFCFTKADVTKDGKVDLDGFDKLVEMAAFLPRKYGFAPTSESMFASESVRRVTR